MSLYPTVFRSTVSTIAARRAASVVASRTYASYPFTRPGAGDSTTSTTSYAPGAKKQYPFTKPQEPLLTTAPNAPVEPAGYRADESPLTLQANDDTPRAPHDPDYNVAADYRSSTFSPIPMRVMDGSEDTDVTAAAVLSGAPTELQARTVRIYQPAKTPTQSGDWHGHHWRMDWDILEKGHRWENPLMGWQSTADFMQGTHMNFKSKNDAIRFAEKQGYEYFVQEPNARRFIPKAYATQFVHEPGKLKQARTK